MTSIWLQRIMGSVAACRRVFVSMCDQWRVFRSRRTHAKFLPLALAFQKRAHVWPLDWFLPALVPQQLQGGADYRTYACSYVCFRFLPVWHHPHRERSALKTGCQTFLKHSTQDLAPACEHNLSPLLSGKVQALFRLTDADQRHGEL